MIMYYKTPPCYVPGRRTGIPGCGMREPIGVCGMPEQNGNCERCGFNPEENERRKGIEFTTLENGLRCRILRKGENSDGAVM